MSTNASPSDQERLPARVFACLVPGEIRIVILPGVGLASGGAERDIPIALVPPELRTPNTPIWVKLDSEMAVARVWKREQQPDEEEPSVS
jgi:hypothetical protein